MLLRCHVPLHGVHESRLLLSGCGVMRMPKNVVVRQWCEISLRARLIVLVDRALDKTVFVDVHVAFFLISEGALSFEIGLLVFAIVLRAT